MSVNGGLSTQPHSLRDFSGGYVQTPETFQESAVQANQLVACQNFDITDGSIRKMKGFSKVTTGTVTGDVSSIWYDRYADKIYVGYGTKLAKLNTTATSIVDLSATTFTNNSIWSFCNVANYLFCVNGVDAPRKWLEATTTLSAITTPPASWGANNYPAFCVHWGNRAFAAGCGTDRDVLFYSVWNNVDSWAPGTTSSAGGAIRIGADGNPIVALIPAAKGLLVVKDKGLYYLSADTTYNTGTNELIYDQTKFDWVLLTGLVDCIGHRALCVVGETLYMWGTEHVYKVSQTQESAGIKVDIVSQAISYHVRRVTTLKTSATAVYHPDRNMIIFNVAKDSGSSTVDTGYCLSLATGGWMVRNGYSHKCMANVRDLNGSTQIYSGGYSGNSYIFKQFDTNNYNGAAMECSAKTYWDELSPSSRGRVHTAKIEVNTSATQSVSYTYAYDYEQAYYDGQALNSNELLSSWTASAGGSIWSTDPSRGQWVSQQPLNIAVDLFGDGNKIQHRFYSNSVDSDYAILGISYIPTSMGYR